MPFPLMHTASVSVNLPLLRMHRAAQRAFGKVYSLTIAPRALAVIAVLYTRTGALGTTHSLAPRAKSCMRASEIQQANDTD